MVSRFRNRKVSRKNSVHDFVLCPLITTPQFESTIAKLLTSSYILKFTKRTEPFSLEQVEELLNKWKSNPNKIPVWQVIAPRQTFAGFIFINFNSQNEKFNDIQVCYYIAEEFSNTLLMYEALGRLGQSLYLERESWGFTNKSSICYTAKNTNEEIKLLNNIFTPSLVKEDANETQWKIPITEFEQSNCKFYLTKEKQNNH